jgi:hypothetical protein
MSRSRLRIPESLRDMARTARSRNWTISLRGSGHLKWRSPDGEIVITPSTPSDSRSAKNARARLRRAGLKEER